MPEVWGLSHAGFKPKDFTTIKEELEKTLKSEVDPYLHFGPGSVAGVLVGIIANQSRQVWEALAGLYHSLQPDTASGRALDALCSLTGTYRRKASFSRAKAKLTLDAHTSLKAGARIKTIAGDFFQTTADVTNNSSGPSQCEVELLAEVTGPKLTYAGSKTTIMTPVAGWSSASVSNTTYIGRNDETDEELRVRRIAELRSLGASTLDAMRSRLLHIDGVEAVHIKEGEHTFEVIVKGGEESVIARTIWVAKPLGTKSEGSIVRTVTDDFKQDRIVKFSRPKLIQLSLHVNLKVKKKLDDPSIKTALTEFSRKHFKLGTEIYPSQFFTTVLAQEDVLDILTLQLRDRASGSNVPAEIKEDEIASLAFDDIHIEQIVEAA